MKNQKVDVKELCEELRSMKSNIFSERDTLDEVLDYVVEAFPEGADRVHGITAVFMAINTLLEQIATGLESEEEDAA